MSGRLTRRGFVAAAAAAVSGCGGMDGDGNGGSGGDDDGGTRTPSDNPAVGDVDQVGDLRLASPVFEDGGSIPERYGRTAENVNPPLSIANVPSDAESLTLIVDDPDAVEPAGEVWLHWLVWNVTPSTTDVPEGWEPPDAVVGSNDFGNRGYDGPDPPDETHTYRFKLYALGTMLDIPGSAGKREVGEAMRDTRLAQTQLDGTYPP